MYGMVSFFFFFDCTFSAATRTINASIASDRAEKKRIGNNRGTLIKDIIIFNYGNI